MLRRWHLSYIYFKIKICLIFACASLGCTRLVSKEVSQDHRLLEARFCFVTALLPTVPTVVWASACQQTRFTVEVLLDAHQQLNHTDITKILMMVLSSTKTRMVMLA